MRRKAKMNEKKEEEHSVLSTLKLHIKRIEVSYVSRYFKSSFQCERSDFQKACRFYVALKIENVSNGLHCNAECTGWMTEKSKLMNIRLNFD